MTTYKFSQMPAWVAKQERVLDAVVSQSVNDLLGSIKIAPGIMRGGSRIRGTVPRDTGQLANSLQSSVHGGTAYSGASSYALVAGMMKAGDVATFTWGTDYARIQHDGGNGMAGTFWITEAASRWPGVVKAVVARARGMI